MNSTEDYTYFSSGRKLGWGRIIALIALTLVAAVLAIVWLSPMADAQELGPPSQREGIHTEECGETSRGVRLLCVYEFETLINVITSDTETGLGEPVMTMFNMRQGLADALMSHGLEEALPMGIELDETGSLAAWLVSELERLQPMRIEVLGGTAVVGNDTMYQVAMTVAEARPDGLIDVRRTYGGTREHTMRELSRTFYTYDDFNPGPDE